MKICFGTVAYNNPDDIGFWINNVRMLFGDVDIVVSDNSTSNQSASKIKSIVQSYSATYISDGKNIGYFPGLNRIMKAVSGCDLYVIGNSDISYDDGFVSALMSVNVDVHQVIAPKVLADSGKDLNPYMIYQETFLERCLLRLKFSSYSLYLLYAVLYKIGLIPLFERINHIGRVPIVERDEIWAAHGCCFVLTKSFISKSQQLPEKTFLWLEENILAVYSRMNGCSINYHPSLICFHKGRGTTGGMCRKSKFLIKKQSFYAYLNILGEYRQFLKKTSC